MDTGMVVVAAGYGSFRTENGAPVPKVVELVRNIPMIAYPLRNAREIGIRRVAVVLNPRDAGTVVKAIEYAIRIGVVSHMPEIVIQPSRAGSADAVLGAIPMLRKGRIRTALITYGDMPMWSAHTFRRVVDATSDGSTVTMVTVVRNERFAPLERYGRIVRRRDGGIRRVIEVDDPMITKEDLAKPRVNPSLWAWDMDWLEDAIPRIVPFKKTDGYGDERYMPPLIGMVVDERRMVSEVPLHAAQSREALGVNTPEELRRLQRFKV